MQLGPFKASDPIARLDNEAEVVKSDLQNANNTIEDLEKRFAESERRVTQARADIRSLVDRIGIIESDSGEK